jgi:hypothetical protein
MDLATFLAETKKKCEATARKMNKIELSIWDAQHEKELKENYGFTDKSLKARKQQLINNS